MFVLSKELRHKIISTLKEAQGSDVNLYQDIIKELDVPQGQFAQGTVKKVDLNESATWEISVADGKELCCGIDVALDLWEVEEPELLEALHLARSEGYEFLIVNYR